MQKEFRLNSGSLKPEFSGFAGFKLLGLNKRVQSGPGRREKPKTSWLGGRQATSCQAEANSLSLRHIFSFSSKKQLASEDPLVRNVLGFLSSALQKTHSGGFYYLTMTFLTVPSLKRMMLMPFCGDDIFRPLRS